MTIKRFAVRFLVIFMVIVFLGGCQYIKELYSPEGVSYVPLGEIPVEGGQLEDLSQESQEPTQVIEIVEEKEGDTKEEENQEDVKEEEKDSQPDGETAKAIVIIASETELVSLVPKADDPDADKLKYTYTSPIGADGRWQTQYGDAGEYTITVTVSDGELSNSRDVLLILNKKEETPKIDSVKPDTAAINIKETESIDFSVSASDLNKDPLTYNWKFDGNDVSDKDSFSYTSTYDDAGAHTVKLDISDGTLTTTQLWSASVENVNRKPVLDEIADIIVKETGTAQITPKATDPDGDTIKYSISDPVGDSGTWETTYDDSGEYIVKVTASDGVDETSQDVKVTVENVNRAPVIVDIAKG